MSRTLYEAAPVTTELDMRLRRIEARIGRMEAALREPATGAEPPVAAERRAAEPAAAKKASAAHRRWAEIGSRLEALGLALKPHYEQAGSGGSPNTLDELRDRVEDAFAATGNAVHDEAVRAEAREVGVMVAEVLTMVGDDMRDALHRAEEREGGTP
jgi:hypothetical protein